MSVGRLKRTTGRLTRSGDRLAHCGAPNCAGCGGSIPGSLLVTISGLNPCQICPEDFPPFTSNTKRAVISGAPNGTFLLPPGACADAPAGAACPDGACNYRTGNVYRMRESSLDVAVDDYVACVSPVLTFFEFTFLLLVSFYFVAGVRRVRARVEAWGTTLNPTSVITAFYRDQVVTTCMNPLTLTNQITLSCTTGTGVCPSGVSTCVGRSGSMLIVPQ